MPSSAPILRFQCGQPRPVFSLHFRNHARHSTSLCSPLFRERRGDRGRFSPSKNSERRCIPGRESRHQFPCPRSRREKRAPSFWLLADPTKEPIRPGNHSPNCSFHRRAHLLDRRGLRRTVVSRHLVAVEQRRRRPALRPRPLAAVKAGEVVHVANEPPTAPRAATSRHVGRDSAHVRASIARFKASVRSV